MRNFSTSMLILVVLVVAGMVLVNTNTHFYESTYKANLVLNGKPLDSAVAYVTMERPDENLIFRFRVEQDDKEVLKRAAGSVEFVCELKNTEFTRLGDFKAKLVATPRGEAGYCKRLEFVWNGLEDVVMTMPSGAQMQLKRIAPKDSLIDNRQKQIFKNFTVDNKKVS